MMLHKMLLYLFPNTEFTERCYSNAYHPGTINVRATSGTNQIVQQNSSKVK